MEDDIRLTRRLKTNVGLHWSAFSTGNRFYHELQPRISARYLITPQLSAKASYSRIAQYVHMLPNSFNGLPRDFWVPTSEVLRPQTADQIAIGVAHNYRENYELSIEGYYKTMTDVLEYKDGASFLIMNETWEQSITQGTGISYGMELLVQKKTGVFTGWMGYMLSWTDRHFEDLNNGKPFPYRYDRRHDFSITGIMRFGKNKKHELSGAWVFSSGHHITLPVNIVHVAVPVTTLYHHTFTPQYVAYSERNAYRMAPYHRLDVSVAFVGQTKWGDHRLVLSVFNAYNRRNPYDITLEWAGKLRYVQYSLFPILPSISYQFKF